MDSNSTSYYEDQTLDLFYTGLEILVAIVAVIGNALVIAVFGRERRLRRRTNYYIVSLAVADLLVGLLGIPFAIMASMGLPSNSLYACLFTVSILMVLCTISIFCLVAVSVDRYWAILHPMDYSRNVRTRTALVIIGICWFAGSFIGFVPLMGWHKKPATADFQCYFLDVMDYNYLVFLYFATIIAPAILLAVFYVHIYHVVLKQLRQIVTMNPDMGRTSNDCTTSSGTMLRVLGAAQKREVKATQNLSIIVLFFMICWIPLYTINCVLAFCNECIRNIHPTLMNSCIILSHMNSAGNPLLYAYHLKDFRAAMKRFILCMVGVKTPPFSAMMARGSASQMTACNSYSHHYRCRSQQYLPQLNQFTHQARTSRSEMSSRNIATIANKANDLAYCEYPRNISLAAASIKVASRLVPKAASSAAVNTEASRKMWRIAELPSQSEDSSHHSEHHDSLPMMCYKRDSFRESTTSRHNNTNLEPMLYLDNDDVFLDDYKSATDYVCMRKRKRSNNYPSDSDSVSSASMLEAHVFLVDNERTSPKNSAVKSKDDSELKYNNTFALTQSPTRSLKLSPYRTISHFFKRHTRSASLSDGTNTRSVKQSKSKKQSYIPEIHSCG